MPKLNQAIALAVILILAPKAPIPEAVVKLDGQPDRTVEAGEPVQYAPGVVHNVCNVSSKPFKALAHYIVEKGKPLTSPAP